MLDSGSDLGQIQILSYPIHIQPEHIDSSDIDSMEI